MTPESKDRSAPFDPSSGSGPEGVLLPPREGGEVVALLVEAQVRGGLWGERTAVALARDWAARGRKVVLVDADVETPSLHEVLGVPNLEGLSDALLYGASPERVMVEPQGEAFRFISSGTVVADPAALRGSERWAGFLEGFRERGEIVLLFIPAGGGGAPLLAARGDRLLRLARPGTPPPEGLRPGFLLHPAGAEPMEPGIGPEPPTEEAKAPRAGVGGTGATEPEGPGLAGGTPGTGGGASFSPRTFPATTSPSPVRTSPARSGPRPRSGGGGRKILLLVVLLVLVLLLVGAWLGLLDLPGF